MGAYGPEKSQEKIDILLSRIKDAETEFEVTLRNYNRVTNPRLKDMAKERLNLLLVSIIKYAVEGIPKEYIGPYPDWIRNNQEKINGLLQIEGVSNSTKQEIEELNASVMNKVPGAAAPAAAAPRSHAAPEPDAFRARQQAQERAQREAEEARAQAERDSSAERQRTYESVVNDPEAILKKYKDILGIMRFAKFGAKGKEGRKDIENIVKLFTVLRDDKATDWHENAKAAYCYVKSIFDKYDVKYYGIGYEIKHQNPVAEACFNYCDILAKAVTSDYNNVHLLFSKTESENYVRICEEKLNHYDSDKKDRPKNR